MIRVGIASDGPQGGSHSFIILSLALSFCCGRPLRVCEHTHFVLMLWGFVSAMSSPLASLSYDTIASHDVLVGTSDDCVTLGIVVGSIQTPILSLAS